MQKYLHVQTGFISIILSILAVIATALPAHAESILFLAALDQDQTEPKAAAVAQAKGSASVTFDTNTNILNWTVSSSGLSSKLTGAHIHGPAGPGEAAGVVINIGEGGLGASILNQTTITAAQAEDLLAGKWYINLHTDQNKPGEIRGQLERQ